MSDEYETLVATGPEDIPEFISFLADKIRALAADTITDDDQEFQPALFFIKKDEKAEFGISNKIAVLPLGSLVNSSSGKQVIRLMMEDAINADGIDVVIMVSEAWLAKIPKDECTEEEARNMRVRDRSDKKEVILLNIMTKDQQFIGCAEISREPTDVGPLELHAIEGKSGGTLVREKKDPDPVVH